MPSVPPDIVTSSTVKFVVGSDAVKNTMIDLSLVVAPSGIGFVPSLAVIDNVNWESFVVEPLETAVPLLLAAVIVAVGVTLS